MCLLVTRSDDYDDTRPLLHLPSKTTVALSAVMVVQVLSRFTLFCTFAYIPGFCKNDLKLSETATVVINGFYIGIIYGIPAVAGGIADAVLGRYKSLFISNCVILLGAIIFLVLVIIVDTGHIAMPYVLLLLITSLGLISFGIGSFNVVLMSFGMDQIANKSNANLWSFFLWRSWFTNIGKLAVAMAFTGDTGTFDSPRMLGMGIAIVVSAALSVAIVIGCKRAFKIEKPQAKQTFRNIKLGFFNIFPFARKYPVYFSNLSYAAQETFKASMHKKRQLFRKVVLFVGIFASYGVYDAIYIQMNSTYREQRKFLKEEPYAENLKMGVFQAFAALSVIPCVELVNRTKGLCKPLSNLSLIGFGTIFIITSPLCAGVLETVIRTKQWPGTDSGISLFFQIPQFVLAGVADVFIFIPSHVFAYDQSPKHAQSFTFGLNYTAGTVVYVVLYVVQAVFVQTPQPDSSPHVDVFEYLFYILVGAALFILLFLFLPLSIMYRRAAMKLQSEADDESGDVTLTESILEADENECLDYGTVRSSTSHSSETVHS
ncbi:solute carrier family 15 member 4-like isoform X2 [Lineus longissimus]|uniref:solute carrier family 15 member 4-like isoform X2 n=1 Tax=Lineus longissimus TaxID=88925 RepID=UPI00315C6AF2